MISVNNNVASLRAQRVLAYNQRQMNISLERLSTGLRINRASDDPAGLIASENLRAEMRQTKAGIENAVRAGNVLATAEGGLQEVSALLTELNSLVVSSANSAGLSREERDANQLQIDAILDTVDRLSGATQFAGKKLLDGSLDYRVSGVNPSQLSGVSVAGAANTGAVIVQVEDAATVGALTYTGGAVGAGGLVIEVAGTLGTQQLAFGSGTTVSAIAAAVEAISAATGVTAVVSGTNVALTTTEFGSKSFVTVRAIQGSFAGGTGTANGTDARVLVNGTSAVVDGLTVTAKSQQLDVSFTLEAALNVAGGVAGFSIDGGGAQFLLGGGVEANNFKSIGIGAVSTGSLGGSGGFLNSLRSGGTNSLSSGNLVQAQRIVEGAIRSTSFERARIGALIKYDIGSTINALEVQYENLSAAESSIRDTDFAAETARLARWQVLTETASAMLAQANQVPSLALRLLEGIRR